MHGLGRPAGRRLVGLWSTLAAILLCCITAAQLRGQQLPQAESWTPEQSLLVRTPKDPQLAALIDEAGSLIENQQYDAAIDLLQGILEDGGDHFRIASGRPESSTLDYAETLLRQLPPDAAEIYRRRYDPAAEQQLNSARSRGQIAEMLNVARLYPLTVAAREARHVAAEAAFDQGETALAARIWKRQLADTAPSEERTKLLLKICQAWTLAGQPDAAATEMQELSQLAQSMPLDYAGQKLTPPSAPDSAWLNKVFGPIPALVPRQGDDWRISGGLPRRWGVGSAVSPVQRGSWTYPLIDRYDTFTEGRDATFRGLLKGIEKPRQHADHQGQVQLSPIVVGSPLIVGDTVLVAGVGSVKALDSRTGAIRWSGVVRDDTFLYWSWRNYEEKDVNGTHDRLVDLYLGQRSWINQTAASLASDGKQVYAISGTGMVGAHLRNMFVRNGVQQSPGELVPPSENRLLAYDISTGLLRWEAGGPPVVSDFNPSGAAPHDEKPLAGAFFLGAPLPVDGQLLVLAEDHGQIRVFSLSPESGEEQWSLPLLNPNASIANDDTRRMFGLSPAYAGGLLICPTGEGTVVAVDPIYRRVVWTHQFHHPVESVDPRAFAMMRFQRNRVGGESPLLQLLQQRRWLETAPILTAGRIIWAPPESQQLICLEFETGKPLWQVPRGDGLFIATCTERHCLIVGERSLQAVRLSDGKIAWSQEIQKPTGRGVVTAGQYILPVSTNELISIDLRSGRILARSSIDPAYRAGALVAARGQMIMQTTSEIVGLQPLSHLTEEIAQQLESAEFRARALSEQGEILMFQGKANEAESVLRASLEIQESAPTRRLLAWSLLDRLKSDYTASRDMVPELKQMITDGDQLALLLRLHAAGLEAAGDRTAAFQEYLNLIRTIPPSESMVELSSGHLVREDRWLRGRLTDLYDSSSESQRESMRQMWSNLASQLSESNRPQLAAILGIELAPELYLELAQSNRLDSFMTQRVYWNLSESRDPALNGVAIHSLIKHELSLQRSTFIGPLLNRLRHELAGSQIEAGVNGTKLLEQLVDDKDFQKIVATLSATDSTPQVNVNMSGGVLQQRDVIPVLGTRRGPYADWQFTLEKNPGQSAHCCDASGRTRHTLNLDVLGERNLRPVRYVQTDSQLVMLVFRDRFVVISPMDQGGNQNQFHTRAMATLTPQPLPLERQQREFESKPGVRDALYPNGNDSYFGNVGPLAFDTLCYQSGDEIFAISPHLKDRKVLWRKSGVPPGSEICADEHYVILIPPLEGKMMVLRSADGVQIAERALPAGLVERQRADWGRYFLVQRNENGLTGGKNQDTDTNARPTQTTWAMYDPVTNRDAWSQTFPAGTRWSPVDGGDLAFLDPAGTIHLIDDQTGASLWSTPAVSHIEPSSGFTVASDAERLYLHVAGPVQPTQPEIREYIHPTNTSLVHVNGAIVAMDRLAGKMVWTRDVEQQLFRASVPVGSGLLGYSAQRRIEKTDAKRETASNWLLFLNRRTGETVLERTNARAGVGDGWARPSAGVMLLRISGQDFRLTWEVDPETQGPSAVPEQEEPQETPADDIKMQ